MTLHQNKACSCVREMKTTVKENFTLETSFLLGCCCWLSWVSCLPVQFQRLCQGLPWPTDTAPAVPKYCLAFRWCSVRFAARNGHSSIIWPLGPPVQKSAHLLDTSVQALLPYRCTHRLCIFRMPTVRLPTCVLHRFCWLERFMEHFPASQSLWSSAPPSERCRRGIFCFNATISRAQQQIYS